MTLLHNVILCSIYVSMIYIIANPIHSSRDSLKEIRSRMIAVMIGTVCCLCYTALVSYFTSSHFSFYDLLFQMGFIPTHFFYSIFYTLLLNTCLFWGPIVLEYTQGEQVKFFSFSSCKQFVRFLFFKEYDAIGLDELFLFRALLIGPITEELVYRSCMQPHVNGILSTAVLFAISHMHHLIEHILHGKLTLVNALMQVLFQFSYTFVFSVYTSHVFVKFNSIYCSILLHAMCNALGFPDFLQLCSQTKYIVHLLAGVACFVYILENN